MAKEIGVTVKRSEDFSEWYTQVVLKSGLADYASIKGFMVLKPYGYEIWERVRQVLDEEFKALGHRNAYFPTLIPESFLKREAEHFKGFTPEVFWVTKTGEDELSERLAVRPTSETIIYDSYAKWIQSWRDLPLLINVWNSVLRAEIKSTKPFIRSSEFLWQEGHTAHETREEADKEVMEILNVYRRLIEQYLAIPVLAGYKSDAEKFVGALYTTTLEAMMPDGKALQMGTSHNLGQNFSKPFEIKFLGRDEKEHYAWTTSWGVSWRLIGAVVMVHGDDKGLVLPPKIAPLQAVIIPIFYSERDKDRVLAKAKRVKEALEKGGVRCMVDDRFQYTPGWKFNDWELKGVPLRVEVGPRDVEGGVVTVARRDLKGKKTVSDEEIPSYVKKTLDDIQNNLFQKASTILKEKTITVKEYDEFKSILEGKGGFLRACWCGDPACEEKVKEETGATIRLISFDEKPFSHCIYCEREAVKVAYFAKAY
ncbi:MAG: proline--tRNA ligase [Candidatus Bathyarchaeia archaeon]